MRFRLPYGQSLDPFLIDAADLHCSFEIGQTGDDRDLASVSHTPKISIALNQDRIRAIAGRSNGRADAAGTAAYDNDVALTNHINRFVGLRNCSDYACHSASLM